MNLSPEGRRLVSRIEGTIELNSRNLMLNLIKLGTKLGVIQEGRVVPDRAPVQNRRFLERYLKVLLDIGVVLRRGEEYELQQLVLSFSTADFENTIPEYITMYDYIASMAHYKAINEKHPNVLMSFGKDADVWDFFLSNPFCRAYREVCRELGGIERSSRVLDAGCGSVSPVFFAEVVAPNGIYRGVEKYASLASLATKRLKRGGYDWAGVSVAAIEDVFVSSKYDCVVCTDLMSYLSHPAIALRNMLKALRKGGRLVMFELFPDRMDFVYRAYEFYNSMNPAFSGFVRSQEVVSMIERLERRVRIHQVGGCFMVVEKRGG